MQAAVYIRSKLREEGVLEKAFQRDVERGTDKYDLVLVSAGIWLCYFLLEVFRISFS